MLTNNYIPHHVENKKQELGVCLWYEMVHLHLAPCFTISYRDEIKFTRITYDQAKEEKTTEKSMIQVFCHDLNMFLTNRKTILASLEAHGKINNSKYETDLQNQSFECMESALKSRREKLQVKNVLFRIFDTKKRIALLKLIEPEVLTSIEFYSPDIDKLVTFLVSWNNGSRLDVRFRCETVSTENLTSIKKMLYHSSTFNQIDIIYESNGRFKKEQLVSFFKPFKITYCDSSIHVEFNLQEKKQENRLSLQDNRLLAVFGNTLLIRKIFERIDCFDVQRLRKVSRDIRLCIDSLKPDLYVELCRIIQRRHRERWDEDIEGCSSTHEYSDTFDFSIRSRNGEMKRIRYRNKELIQDIPDWHVNEFVYCGDTVDERVVNDFKINIEHQKSTMNELQLDCDGNMLKLIGNVLKSRDTRLSVKKLHVRVTDESDIMNILPYLDSVEAIEIHSDHPSTLNLIEVLKLDQWENVFDLYVSGCINYHELDLLNFRRINIKIDSLSTNDIIYFKEKIEKSVKFNNFIFWFKKKFADHSRFNLMPPPYKIVHGYRTTWFFPLPNTNSFLRIQLNQPRKYLCFERFNRDSVPIDFLITLV